MGAPTPQFMQQPFGANAGPTFITTPPNTTGVAGRASLNLGFPPLTMTPIIAGGVPPFGQDMNGILYMLSTHAFASQAGQAPLWSSDIATAIAGYALGTVLGSTDGSTLWFNITNGNTTDPDGGSSAGWIPLKSYGITTVAGVTGGVTTLTPAQARKSVLQITGALVGNAAVVLPNWVAQNWLIVNNTSGAFTVTVRTAAGTGVVIPQGGFDEPVGVYGDGTNIYPVVTPLSIPTSAGPDPDTYALRTSAGYLLATYFNMSGSADNVGLTNVMYEAGDGFLRKMSQANFRAHIFADSALTGTPTAPTAAPGTSTVQLATTAFVQAAIVSNQSKGGIVAANGAAIALPPGWSSVRTSLGHWTVTHGVYLANTYAVTITMYNTANPFRVQWSATPGTGSFTVVLYSATDGAFADNAFQFTLVPIA